MQPNDQQGYYNPEATQPAPVMGPPQPPAQAPVGAVDPAALQQALAEPAPVQAAPAPAPSPAPAVEEPLEDEEYGPEEFEDEEPIEPVSWSAHEYIHHEKGTMWFVLFAVIIIALIGLSVWIQAWSFTILTVVIAVVVVVYSRRPPRELGYSLTEDGLMIDNDLHKFDDFKSFGVIQDGEHFSVMLIPTQRFQPGITVYFPEESGEAIVDALGSRLPMKELHLDAIDRVVRFLRL